MLMANGKLIKMLMQTGVTRYLDFNGVDGSYVFGGSDIYKVPVTPKEALKTSLVGFFQKRNLRNFAEFVGTRGPPTSPSRMRTQASGCPPTERGRPRSTPCPPRRWRPW